MIWTHTHPKAEELKPQLDQKVRAKEKKTITTLKTNKHRKQRSTNGPPLKHHIRSAQCTGHL